MGNIFKGNDRKSNSSRKKDTASNGNISPNRPEQGKNLKTSKLSSEKVSIQKPKIDKKKIEEDDIKLKSQDWKENDDILEKHKITKITSSQDYYKLKTTSLEGKKLFDDPEFSPSRSLLVNPNDIKVEWLRPHDICKRLHINKGPKMFVNNFNRFDINQGTIGACWFLAALANLAENKDYFQLVVSGVIEKDVFDKNYAGIFRFRFWKFGEWIEVVVDDYLPTKPSRKYPFGGSLLYLRSVDENEFWSALLEKAYAKLNGGYSSLEVGLAIEATTDFTGGVPELMNLENSKLQSENLFRIFKRSYERRNFMTCTMVRRDLSRNSEGRSLGLVSDHAYTISKIVEIDLPNHVGRLKLLRIRNPHGNYKEWKGAWSDRDENWNSIPEAVKKELAIRFKDDGEFYISFDDFLKYFGQVQLCHLTLDPLDQITGEKKFDLFLFHGAWHGITAGGCGNDGYKAFSNNPQYFITLNDPDPNDDEANCHVIISLAQKIQTRKTEFAIGFEVYKCDNDLDYLDAKFLKTHKPVNQSDVPMTDVREVSRRLLLPKGRYCIIPCTFKKGQERGFLLRVFIETHWGNAEGVRQCISAQLN